MQAISGTPLSIPVGFAAFPNELFKVDLRMVAMMMAVIVMMMIMAADDDLNCEYVEHFNRNYTFAILINLHPIPHTSQSMPNWLMNYSVLFKNQIIFVFG